MRDTGIDIIGRTPWGTHFCQFYETAQDLVDILVPYFAAGLRQNEFCMWVTSEPLGVAEAKSALAKAVGDLEPYFRSGQLEILDYGEWYTAGGRFETDRVLQGWIERLEAAQEKGFEGLRLTGNTLWIEQSDWRDFTEYEATIDGVIGQYRILALCTYSLAKCGAPEILDVMANHAFALIRRGGAWQIIESAERRRTEEALRESLARLNRTEAIAHLGSWELDVLTNRLSWSDEVYRIFGLQPQEFGATYEAFLEAVHPDDRAAVDAAYTGSLREGKESYEIEHRVLRRSTGEVRWVHERCEHVTDPSGRIIRSVGMVLDITDGKRTEQALLEAERAQVRLAQTLTSEIAHRTKNNLAIVAGLLQLQLDREATRCSHTNVINDAVTRVMSFAELHEQMYQRRSDTVELLDALRRIAEVDRQALSADDVTISVEGDPAEYPSSTATNLCVVANELLTNAFKHGPSHGSMRQVEVRLTRQGRRLVLSVWNSGKSIAADFDVRAQSGTGLVLVRSIVEDQYGGSFTIAPDRGGTLARIVLDDERLREE